MIYTWLRSFHAVASEGSFTVASRALNIGQPTVTSQVKALEDYYSVELFHRRGRGVERGVECGGERGVAHLARAKRIASEAV